MFHLYFQQNHKKFLTFLKATTKLNNNNININEQNINNNKQKMIVRQK